MRVRDYDDCFVVLQQSSWECFIFSLNIRLETDRLGMSGDIIAFDATLD